MQVGLRSRAGKWRTEVHPETGGFRMRLDNREYRVEILSRGQSSMVLSVDGTRFCLDVVHQGRDLWIGTRGEAYRFEPDSGAASGQEIDGIRVPEVIAPMPGRVTRVLKQSGERVDTGDVLIILEAMKMENRLLAEGPGLVREVRVSEGDMVNGGQLLVVLDFDE